VQAASEAGADRAAGPGREHDHPHPPQKRPLPSFSGTTLDGRTVSARDLLGRRLLLFIFNPEAPEAGPAAEAVVSIQDLRAAENFEILGIATAADREAIEAFVASRGIRFPVIDDSSGRVATRLVRAPVALFGVDAEGNLSFALAAPSASAEEARESLAALLRERLRLPEPREAAAGVHPPAPDFTGPRLDGGEPFHLGALRGRPVVLIFFLHTCPHCHEALETLKSELPAIPEERRPALVGVSVQDKPYAVRAALESAGLDFFPVVMDPDGSIRRAFGVFGGVPDIFLIDAEGRIRARFRGWREGRDPALLRMRLAALAGVPVPMLLAREGYSGGEVCGVCHERETLTWELTRHAVAFDTLVRHGADSDPECVGCHVVGYGEPGGWSLAGPRPELEDVGCESCHGRGGPHLSPGFVRDGNYEPVCLRCHDEKHSLGFDYARFLPHVSHAANAHLAELPPAERARLLAERGGPRPAVLGGTAPHVGSEACRSCHPAEYETWARGRHARSVESLAAKDASEDPACLRCHTTGFGQEGGFPEDGSPADHPDLARVGCESCHGPGGNHVPEQAPKRGTILSLSDKCDTCVILEICGSCHDEANDPGFEFEVEEKIEAQRHGTLDRSGAAAGPPLPPPIPADAQLGLLERAFGAAGFAPREG